MIYPFQVYHPPKTASQSRYPEEQVLQKYTPKGSATPTNIAAQLERVAALTKPVTFYTNPLTQHTYNSIANSLQDLGGKSNNNYPILRTQSLEPPFFSMASSNTIAALPKELPTQQLNALRKERLEAQRNVQMLASRVALLQQEEQKALKQIEQTQKRTKELVKSRHVHQHKREVLQEFRKQQDDLLGRKIYENKVKKEVLQKSIVLNKARHQHNLQKEVSNIRVLKDQLREEQQMMQNELLSRNALSYQDIKAQEQALQLKKQTIQQHKKLMAQTFYKQKKLVEYFTQVQSQRELELLEQREQEMLQKLKQTQSVQENVIRLMHNTLQESGITVAQNTPIQPSSTKKNGLTASNYFVSEPLKLPQHSKLKSLTETNQATVTQGNSSLTQH